MTRAPLLAGLRWAAVKAAGSAIGAVAGLLIALAVAMVGVGVAAGPEAGFDVPGEIVQGFGVIVEAAQKYIDAEG